ncbi:hypothetical protein [Saccharophagus degradans]|uniref:Uncharacterized protein n=1 Tax=Saccharophagus degradans (strain 2-40 / ATCC 43961 / DSM 17024) TaxID=203122 RepID=Q21K78_SACD2|nr:hypothetical protein [Saccharophagus degradans]ABD80901.1 conserved hypothetical protein [Saccharophagus degradans 2-40]
MTDIYTTPNSELIDSETPAFEAPLFKLVGIGLATAFGSVIAGGYLMARNYKSMGEHRNARSAIIYSAVGFVAIMLLAAFIPESWNVSNTVFTVTQIIVMVQLAKRYQGAALDAVKTSNGSFQSNWKAFGISLLFLLFIGVVVFGVVFAAAYFTSWSM